MVLLARGLLMAPYLAVASMETSTLVNPLRRDEIEQTSNYEE
jgi:hypothetical protein